MSLTNRQAFKLAWKAIYDTWDDGEKQLLDIPADEMYLFESALKKAFPHRATKAPQEENA